MVVDGVTMSGGCDKWSLLLGIPFLECLHKRAKRSGKERCSKVVHLLAVWMLLGMDERLWANTSSHGNVSIKK
jgi:hypothetical protein